MTILRSPDTLVLMYHRVVDAPRDPFWLTVTPDRFADHLSVLAERAEVVPLQSVRTAGKGPRVALTFDDGYRDNLDAAASLLAVHGMPATVFIATRIFDDPSPFWWDVIEHLVLDAEQGVTDVVQLDLGRTCRFDVRDQAGRDRILQVLGRILRPMTGTERQVVIDALGQQLATSVGPCDCHAVLDRDGVAELGRIGGLSLGAHTVHHVQLGALDRTRQYEELKRSRDDLESLGVAVRTAAYPFGGHGDWDRRSAQVAADCGFDLTVTAIGGDVTKHTPRHRVPRHAVRNWDGDEFARHLDQWFAGMELVS